MQAEEIAPPSHRSQILELSISGMSCAACSARIEKVLNKKEGVEAVVNLATERARIQLSDASLSLTDIISSIEKIGYGARPVDLQRLQDEQDESEREQRKRYTMELIRFWTSAALSLPLMLPMLLQLAGIHWTIPGYLQLFLATPVQFWIGWKFYRGAYKSLRSGSANMDVLVALGTSMAYGWSMVVTLLALPLHIYFEASTMVITLVLLGKILESRAKRKTSDALNNLLALQPREATLIQPDGSFQTVPVNSLLPGSKILVKPGESMAVDGVIHKGESALDESMLTGESMPVEKKEGDRVYTGSVNFQGTLQVVATGVGSATALGEIIRIVQEAQGSRAPIQRLADRISSVFVPVVVSVGAFSGLFWYFFTGDLSIALINSVAVLVIACPCALGLATPTAIMVGSGLGAKSGILIRNAEALEIARKIDTLIVDKTGTITEGKPSIIDVIPADGVSRDRLIAIAASLESHSQHPIARAIVQLAIDTQIPLLNVDQFQMGRGAGITGEVDGHSTVIGSPEYLAENKIDIPYDVTMAASGDPQSLLPGNDSGQSMAGSTVVGVAQQDQLLGWIAVADTVRPSSRRAVEELKKMGIEVIMLTGDNRSTADAVAKTVGIATYQANILPEQKADVVNLWREKERIVGMVGDGINDAPALTSAHVGFAMKSGTDIAIQASDITIMRNDLMSVVNAIRLSRATVGKIRQNLFFAFIYNVLGIPLAAMGFLEPMIAGAAMAMSSVSVVTSSLLLRRWKGLV